MSQELAEFFKTVSVVELVAIRKDAIDLGDSETLAIVDAEMKSREKGCEAGAVGKAVEKVVKWAHEEAVNE